MPTLDEIDTILAYKEDQTKYLNSLQHHIIVRVVPKALSRGKVKWIMKNGQEVEEG